VLDLQNHVRLAKAVEQVGMDFALIADGYAPGNEASSRVGFQDPTIDAVTWMVPLMLATTHLGFLSTLHTRFLHPTVIARMGAHLDWLSGGRWGWNVVNGYRDNEAALFGYDEIDRDDGYDLAEEAVQIVKALWSNPPGGIDHVGPKYKVRGRIRRPVPETLPLLVNAASSQRGRKFAATNCDYLFAGPRTGGDIADVARDLERNASAAGRSEPPRILVLCDIFVRDEPGRAAAEYQELWNTTDREAQELWNLQLIRVVHPGRDPEKTMCIAGTVPEVVEQIIELSRIPSMGGFMFRLPLWSAEEVLRLQPVFDELERAGIWRPPQTREYCW
jgi:FMNH2-dependent dimethyl sulfone monooxygenase